jgi:hypothetical protein
MDLDGSHLNDLQQAFGVLDVEIFVTLAFVPEVEGMDVLAQAPPRTTLKKTLLSIDAGRTAQQAERVACDARQHERRDGSVIFSERAFRDVSCL